MSTNRKAPQSRPSTENKRNTSNIVVSIEDMAQLAIQERTEKHIKDLEANNLGLAQTVEKLMAELTRKEDLIKHLEHLLGNSAQIIQTGVIMHVSDEEQIVMKQLERLKQDAMVRALTLDEMKILDLAVKNKRLSQGNPTTIDGKKNTLNALPHGELMKIASTPLNSKGEK